MVPTIDLEKTGMNIRQIMKKRGVTAKQIQSYLGLSCVQSVYHWLTGMCLPSMDNLYALSELLQVPIDSLICGNRKGVFGQNILVVDNSHDKRVIEYHIRLSNLQGVMI